MLPLSAADNGSTDGSAECCFSCLKDDQGKIKTNTLVSKEGSGAGSIQMDTLDTVKSSRRQQAAGERMCAWSTASFWLKGWHAKTTCSGHNPPARNGLIKKELAIH